MSRTFGLPLCLYDASTPARFGLKATGDNEMTAQTTQTQKRTFAVAVRDGADLFLVLTICRGPQGDVYVNFPRDHEPDWKPHSSYHASGQHHHKSFGHKPLVRHAQKPNASLTGTENVVTTGITSDEPRAGNTQCVASDFQEVFEIPLAALRPEKYHTMTSVDIAEPNESAGAGRGTHGFSGGKRGESRITGANHLLLLTGHAMRSVRGSALEPA
jgi:hypothetical protein